ncbi:MULTISPECIES: DUF5392 family protein [Alteribacter]|uniref:Uncharacterized protein n=1 Tax=Alteribacter keqinensis TaxID=2483800 RepID=A0A3M7TNS1_9BACI|nr:MULTISPECIES: DUF5392 family protein [Alteribacter]MBM7096705.1 DUF5392 family protein [Alteribacter salitolerans]RNA66255.1 hypothetical protein EBO34_19225 [Alteribacter keqinensis]
MSYRELHVHHEIRYMRKASRSFYMNAFIFGVIATLLFCNTLLCLYYLIFDPLAIGDRQLFQLIQSIIGAFSIALFIEAFYQKRIGQVKKLAHIRKRIKASVYFSKTDKKKFIKMLRARSTDRVSVFREFLQKEERLKSQKDLRNYY